MMKVNVNNRNGGMHISKGREQENKISILNSIIRYKLKEKKNSILGTFRMYIFIEEERETP